MDEVGILGKVVTVLEPYVKNEEALKKATGATSILNDLQVNSARLVDIILALEDEFDIEIDDDAADSVQTLQDAVNVIVAQKGG
jgi:acyl carrier protein